MVTLALEVQGSVDDVLERFRPGQAAILRHVADEKGRNVLTLRGEQELRRRFTHLTDAAGRRLKFQREDRLHRIDDDEGGPDARDLLENALEARLGEQIQRRGADR